MNTRIVIPVDQNDFDELCKRVEFLERILRKSTVRDEPISDDELWTIHSFDDWRGQTDD